MWVGARSITVDCGVVDRVEMKLFLFVPLAARPSDSISQEKSVLESESATAAATINNKAELNFYDIFFVFGNSSPS